MYGKRMRISERFIYLYKTSDPLYTEKRVGQGYAEEELCLRILVGACSFCDRPANPETVISAERLRQNVYMVGNNPLWLLFVAMTKSNKN